MIADFFKYSMNNIGKRRMRSWLTMFGIFIGMASVVALIGLGQGLQDAVLGEFSSLGTDKILVQASGGFGPPGSSSAAELTLKDFDVVEAIPGSKLVSRRVLKSVSFEFDDQAKFPFAASMPAGKEARDLVMEANGFKMAKGRMLEEDDGNKVVLADGLANDALYRRPIEPGDSVFINGQKFDVVGILQKSGGFSAGSIVLMNEDKMRELLDLGDFISMIIVQVNDVNDMDSMALQIERKLRQSRGVKVGDEDFDVQTPQQIIDSFESIFLIVQGVVIGIAGISLVVGAIGIMNTMYTSVLERRKEIGIMKSIGAKNTDILQIFMIESGFLGAVGGFVGIIFGVLLGKTVEYGSKFALGESLLQANFNIMLLAGVLLFSITIGLVSGYLPARQASALKPVDALRS